MADGVGFSPDNVPSQDVNEVSKEGFVLWQNEKIKLEIIMKPHLRGLHLMVSPKESYQRQWQTVAPVTDAEKNSYIQQEQIYLQQTLEVTAVAMGAQKLLAEGRGELHNSGNWAGGLKATTEGGALNLEKLTENGNIEKRSHRPNMKTTNSKKEPIKYTYPYVPFGTNMHTHVYLPTKGPVILPEMSEPEAKEKGRTDIVAQWGEEFRPETKLAQVEEIRAKLGEGKLTKWLEENCKGQLINKTA